MKMFQTTVSHGQIDPLTTVEIKPFDANDELPYDAPVVVALCEKRG